MMYQFHPQTISSLSLPKAFRNIIHSSPSSVIIKNTKNRSQIPHFLFKSIVIVIWKRLASSCSKLGFMPTKNNTIFYSIPHIIFLKTSNHNNIFGLLLLSSNIDLHFWGSKSRRLHKMQVGIPKTTNLTY